MIYCIDKKFIAQHNTNNLFFFFLLSTRVPFILEFINKTRENMGKQIAREKDIATNILCCDFLNQTLVRVVDKVKRDSQMEFE